MAGEDRGSIEQDRAEGRLPAAVAAKVSVDRVWQISTHLAALQLTTRVQVDSNRLIGHNDRVGQACTMLGELSLTDLWSCSQTITDQLADVEQFATTCTGLDDAAVR